MNDIANVLAAELEPMWRFALRLTANEADAEDLVQQTCLKALENAHRYDEKGRQRSWLFRIEHRIWLNQLRSRQIRHAGSFNQNANGVGHSQAQDHTNADLAKHSELIVDEHSPESELRLQQVYSQVESLPEAQRLVVVLVCDEGFTYHESADILDIPIGTVMSRLARARITLGKFMLANKKKVSAADKSGAGLQ